MVLVYKYISQLEEIIFLFRYILGGGEKNRGGDKLVRTMTPWKGDQSLKLNRKVLESIIAVSCLKGRAFLISNGDTFTLYIGNKIARRDLKQFSRLACKLDISLC